MIPAYPDSRMTVSFMISLVLAVSFITIKSYDATIVVTLGVTMSECAVQLRLFWRGYK